MLQLPTNIFLELYSNNDKIESSNLCDTCTHCAYCQAIPDAVGNSETRETVQCYCYSKQETRPAAANNDSIGA